MFLTVLVELDQRAVVLQRGLPIRALGPGRHTVWGFGLTVRRWSTTTLLFDMPAEMRAVLPADWFREITLAPHERAVLWLDGKPRAFLGPGTHRFWEVDDPEHLQVFSVLEPMPELTSELASIIPRTELTELTVAEHERALLYVQGRFVRLLTPGRVTFWSTRENPVTAQTVDLRLQQTTLTGQELMTRDKVTLRLSLTVEFAIEDPLVAVHGVTNVRDAIYLAVQLAARDLVANMTLDELLAGRDVITKTLEQEVVEKGRRFGVRVERVGLKDIVLPGEMKTLLNKVIEAEKEAAANVILRREETAATRSLANTAKLMTEQPLLLRLKELDSLKEMAAKIHELRLVVAPGMNGSTLSQMMPTGFLGDASDRKRES